MSGGAEVRFVTTEPRVEKAAEGLRRAALDVSDDCQRERDGFIDVAAQSIPTRPDFE